MRPPAGPLGAVRAAFGDTARSPRLARPPSLPGDSAPLSGPWIKIGSRCPFREGPGPVPSAGLEAPGFSPATPSRPSSAIESARPRHAGGARIDEALLLPQGPRGHARRANGGADRGRGLRLRAPRRCGPRRVAGRSVRLHRPRRRVRGGWFGHGAARHLPPRLRDHPDLAAQGRRQAGDAAAARRCEGEARGRHRAGRLRSGDGPSLPGPHAQLPGAGGGGVPLGPGHVDPVDLARGLVDLRHRRRRQPAQHLRLPHARSMLVHAGALQHRHAHGPAEHQPGLREGPLRPARGLQDPPEEPALLEAARRQPDLVVDRPRADHVPAAEVQERNPAERDVRPRPPGHAGELQLLHHRRVQARLGDRRSAIPRGAAWPDGRVEPQGPAGTRQAGDEGALLGRDGSGHRESGDHRRQGDGARRGRRVHAVDGGSLRRRPGHRAPAHPALGRRGGEHLRHADQHRPRVAGDADQPPVRVLDLPGQDAGQVRDPGSRGGHVGAERAGHRRGGVPRPVLPHLRGAQEAAVGRARQDEEGLRHRRVRHHRPGEPHVLATLEPSTPRTRARRSSATPA